MARMLFPEADDRLLKYMNEDGQVIEPDYYLPILPLLLVNGAEGIGTGWSTSVPNYKCAPASARCAPPAPASLLVSAVVRLSRCMGLRVCLPSCCYGSRVVSCTL